jgi:hypothetical protein
LPRKTLPREDVLTLLAAAPPRIAACTVGIEPALLRTTPAPDEWSANDVLAHLRACADVWGGCIARILDEDEPTLRAMDPRTWMPQTDYPALEFHPSLQAFSTQRAELLARLEPRPQAAWERSANVTGAGRPLVRTVHFYAQWLATHERTHIRQIERVISTLQSRRQLTTQ